MAFQGEPQKPRPFMDTFAPEKRTAYLAVSGRKSWEQSAGKMKCPALLNAIYAQEALISGWDAVHNLASVKNPKDTTTAHREKVVKQAQRIYDQAAPRINRAQEGLRSRQAEIDQEINKKLGILDRGGSPEIRAALRTLSDSDRRAAIMSAIKNKDEVLLSAVFTGHPVTMGIPEKDLQGLREHAKKKIAPELVEYKRLLQKVDGILYNTLPNSIELISQAELSEAEKMGIEKSEEAQGFIDEHLSKISQE